MSLPSLNCITGLCFIISLINVNNGIVWYEPQQVHISTASFDQMIIVWSTVNDTTDSIVLYGKDVSIGLEATGISRKFVHDGPLQRVQYVHKVILTGLSPETKYTYMVGSKKYGFSDLFSFKTWPAGDKWSPSLAIYGDLGNLNAQSLPRLQVEAASGMYHSILHVGDFAYDMNVDNGEVGDAFMRQIEPVASSLPYMTCPGNHEEASNFSEYRNRFEMPGDESKRMYYSFTMGPVRFISVSTELIFFPQYGIFPIFYQYEWLKQELINANKPEERLKHPWVITFGHRPMYCSNEGTDDCSYHESLVRVGIPYLHLPGWEKLFYENGVDLAIWAHEHSYERLWPVYNRQVKNGSYDHPYTNPRAPVHIITGSAGCQEDHSGFNNQTEAWSAFRAEDYGYTRMKVYNATHLYMEQVSDDKEGEVIDKFMIIKDRHGSFATDDNPVKPVGEPPSELLHFFETQLKKLNFP